MADNSAAPGPLEQVRTFLNTWSIPNDTRAPVDELRDLITSSERWTSALPDVPLPTIDGASAEFERLLELRSQLRAALGETSPTSLGAVLNMHRWRVEVTPADHAPAVRIVPEVPTTSGALLAAVVEAISAGTWHRLRACPDCGWVFFDSSRNARRTWCSMTAAGGARGCGSIAKTRAYRARHR